MKVLTNFVSQFSFVVVLLFSLEGNCTKIQNGNDKAFRDFLWNKIKDYTAWIKENDLDPSPPIISDHVMVGSINGVELECDYFRNHSISGHSNSESYDIYIALSNFTQHVFGMGKRSHSPHGFHGEILCFGTVLSSYYTELRKDLYFDLDGNFTIITNYSYEYLEMENVGITNDYRLDLSNSWPIYMLNTTELNFQFEGYVDWIGSDDNTLKHKYDDIARDAFADLYQMFTITNGDGILFPSGELLKRYVLEMLERVDLTQIMDEDDLPDTYVPTPSTPATTSTTTTTTSTTTTTDRTTSTTTKTTTTGQTTPTTIPNAGERTAIHSAWLIVLQSLLVWLWVFSLVRNL